MGKASLALDITRHVADELHKSVGVYSLEMRADELGLKLLSAEPTSPPAVPALASSQATLGGWGAYERNSRKMGTCSPGISRKGLRRGVTQRYRRAEGPQFISRSRIETKWSKRSLPLCG